MSTGFESASFEFEVADDFEGESSFVSHPGTYHAIVEDVKVGVGPRGNAFEGSTVAVSVLAGNPADEAKKTFNHMLGFPRATDKDGGKFRTKVMSKFMLAVNQINPADRGKKATFDASKIVGQQFVMEIVHGRPNDQGKSYLEVGNGGLAVYHVDDPHVATVPKDQAALQLIPAALRHDAKWFEQVYTKAKPAAPAPVAPHAEASRVDLSQL